MNEITGRVKAAIADRYKIEREIGEGGMATVYLAHDVKHDRKVALKVLRPELAAVIGAERFLQEIKVTANLQHPHILPLHDSGQIDTFLYYVMPYVEGDTLRDKLKREKQLGVDDAIEITRNVASALDYAHRQNVIHRDIKPENILLHDGQALIADFGIALAVSEASGNRLTETGLSIGTPHYMSPEQAMGDRELDARSDIYSLGAMLYEMLAGDPPYQGSTAQAIVAKVITEKAPPVTAVRDTVPSHVAAAIQKALSKLPADRFPSAAAFAEALVTPGSVALPATAVVESGQAAQPRDSVRVALAAGLALAIGIAGWGWLRSSSEPPLPQPTRFALELGASFASNQGARLLDVSPDGSTIAYVGIDSMGTQKIFLRHADAIGPTPLPETEAALQPVFSPDGEWLAFTQDGDLKKVRLDGGRPLTIVRGRVAWGVHWAADNTIIFRDDLIGSIEVVSAAGGTPRRVASDSASIELRWPELLPDGETALVTYFPSLEEAQVALLHLADGTLEMLVAEGTHPHYVGTGHIVYGHPAGGVFAVPFDLATHQVMGEPAPLLDDVLVFGGGATQFAVSQTGTALYAGGSRAQVELLWVDHVGHVTPIPGEQGAIRYPRVGPRGRRIAFLAVGSGAGADVHIQDLARGTRSRVTFVGTSFYPRWSADGEWLLFSNARKGSLGRDVYRKRADGSGPAEVLLTLEGSQSLEDAAPDGSLLYREGISMAGNDLFVMLPGDSTPRSFLANPWNELAADVAPDGRWVAYTSDETGTTEVYVTSYPESGGRWQVSQGGGLEPVWSPDGRTIYYWKGNRFLAATVQTDPTFAVTGDRVLFTGTFSRSVWAAEYDVHPDGQRFVMLQNKGGAESGITVVVNWFTELRERLGEGQ